MRQRQFQQLGLSTQVLNAPLAEEVMAADGQTMNCLGTFQLLVSLGEYEVVTDVAVFEEVDGILLAWYLARDLGLLPADYPSQRPVAINSIQMPATGKWAWIQNIHQATPMEMERAHTLLLEKFVDVLRDPADFKEDDVLPTMTGPAMEIHLQYGA